MATSHSMTNNLPHLTHPDGSPIRALVVDDEQVLRWARTARLWGGG